MSHAMKVGPGPIHGRKRSLQAAALLASSLFPLTSLAQQPATDATPPPGAAAPASPAAASPTAASPAAASSEAASTPAQDTPPAQAAVGPQRALRTHTTETPPSAFNPRTNRVRWDERWPRFHTAEYVATGVFGIGVFAALAIPPVEDRWRDMGSFDEGARNTLRLRTQGARNTARDASDLVLGLMINQLVVDATLVAWWGHDRPSVGYQMVLIDLEALAFTGAVQAIVSGVTSRWRPFRDTCKGPLETQTRDCRDNKQYRSFFSGHTSGAFTAAGLMCMHHAYLPLYGGGTRESLTCAASFAAAATVGMLRVVADQHFLSDALVGAAIGTLSGLGLPWVLHYRGGAQEPQRAGGAKRGSDFSVHLAPAPMGLAASGEF